MRRPEFPHPLTLLTCGVLLAAALSYILPAGQFDRVEDEATDRTVVVAGTYERVERAPVGLFRAMVAVPRGMVDAAEVVFLIFLIGGAFTVVDQTGAFRSGVEWLTNRLADRDMLVIPAVAVAFAIGGITENLQEEIIAVVPALMILTRRLGFAPLVAVAMSAGAAFVGSSFSPMNPFQVGIAQKLSELPLLSGGLYRTAFLIVALSIWIGATMRLAARTRGPGDPTQTPGDGRINPRHATVLGLVTATFAIMVYGLIALRWDFNEMSGLFFLMGIGVGLIGGLRVTGTAKAYADGFREMAYAALLVGFARAIFVVLDDGRIVDTIVNAMFSPLADLPLMLSALGMMVSHTIVHVPVPSTSGHAVLTMPLLVPLSDLLGLSRQVTILAYQYGAGLCELITPTNGALLAILGVAGVRYEDWLRFTIPWWLVLMGLGAISVVLAILIGLQ